MTTGCGDKSYGTVARLLSGLLLFLIGCSGASRESPDVVRRLAELKARAKSVGGSFTSISVKGTPAEDGDAEMLSGLRRLQTLDLTETAVTDRGVQSLSQLPELQGLSLAKTLITDASLKNLERFPKLRILLLNDTAITDRGLAVLQSVSALVKVDVRGTKVTTAGVQQFRTARPQCEVVWTPGTSPSVSETNIASAPSVVPMSPVLMKEQIQRRRQVLLESWREPDSTGLPADLEDNLVLSWNDGDLPGGAVVPRWRQQHGPRDVPASRFQKVIGIMPGSVPDELIFLGTEAEGWPLVSTEDLLDACAVGWQSAAMGQPGGVTFEPTQETLVREPRDGDLLNIEYFGAAADTVVGQASYEADRLMKCLSAGQDNLTRQPLGLSLAGWQSELERGLHKPSSENSAWHRFWIEPRSGLVRTLRDGSLRLVDLRLGIETRHQQIRRGELTDSKHAADPSARAFADDLTRFYDQIAREHPSFAAVYNFAAVASLVAASFSEDANTTPVGWETLLTSVDPRWFRTPQTTPSMIVKAERQSGNVRQFAQIAGGVTLKPVAARIDDDSELKRLRERTLSSRPARQNHWTVETSPRRVEAAAVRTRRRAEFWQTDLRSGALHLVRDLVPCKVFGGAACSTDWQIRVPRLQRDPVIAKLEKGGAVERSLTIYDADGMPQRLSPGRVSLPTSPGETTAYTSRDGKHTLAQYKNVWIQIDEPVRFLSVSGGRSAPTPEEGGRWIEYSPTAPHSVRAIQTSSGRTDFDWDGPQLRRIRSQDGELRFNYDSQGRFAEATTREGVKTEYRYDLRGALTQVLRNGQIAQEYEYDRDGSMYRAYIPSTATFETSIRHPLRTTVAPRTSQATDDAVAQQIADAGASVLTLRVIPYGNIQLVLNGRQVLRTISADALEELSEEVVASVANAVRESQHDAHYPVLLNGPANLRQRLAVALRPRLDDYLVTDTDILQRSFRKLISSPISVSAVRHEVVENVDREIIGSLKSAEDSDPNARAVFLVGHNDGIDGEFGRKSQSLTDAGVLEDGYLIMSTCFHATNLSMADAALTLGKAKGVFSFLQPIDARLLPYVQAAFTSEVKQQASPLDCLGMQNLFLRAIDSAKSRARQDNKGFDEQDLNLLDLWSLQTRNVTHCQWSAQAA